MVNNLLSKVYSTITGSSRQKRVSITNEVEYQVKKSKLDDDFYSYLVEGADFEGEAGIPVLLDLRNTQVPHALLPFEKRNSPGYDKRRYIHFYMHDRYFGGILTNTNRYIKELQQFDGVITPDFTMLVGRSKCLLETQTYFNRAVGFYLQKQGIPVIPNIRWSDHNSYEFCFLGVPKNTIVAVSTHGCIKSNLQKKLFKEGIAEMLHVLQPSDVLVHGSMPDCVFGDFMGECRFHRFPSLIEQKHDHHDRSEVA